jgi:hypothetical protein
MNAFTEPRNLRLLFESISSLFIIPFIILLIVVLGIVFLITLLIMWPLAPFFVYAERKKELTEDTEEND